jgi:hypothetical protein
LIKQYASFGVAVSVCESEFNRWFPRNEHVPNAYSICCWMCLVAVKSWITRNKFSGKVAYFFEAGHINQADANNIMKNIFKNQVLRQSYQYAAHAFVPKEDVRPVQAADILAWQHRTHIIRAFKGNPIGRKDYASMLDLPHEMLHINESNFQKIITFFEGKSLLSISGEATGYFLPTTTVRWSV